MRAGAEALERGFGEDGFPAGAERGEFVFMVVSPEAQALSDDLLRMGVIGAAAGVDGISGSDLAFRSGTTEEN